MAGRVVHVRTTNRHITSFMDVQRQPSQWMMCFRCGQQGHARYQCMTYRTRLCPSMDACKEDSCAFAHSVEELRRPWEARCVRVIKQGSRFICIGCNSTEHTFRHCPLHRDLIFMR